MADPWTRRVEIGPHVLYLGDCLEIMRTLDTVDAVITDPPYASGGFTESAKKSSNGMGNRSETRAKDGWFAGDSMTTAGISWLLREVAGSSYDLLPPGGTIALFTDWRMVGHLAPAIESARVRYQNLIVWNKGVAGIGAGFRAQHEMCMLFAKGTPKYFNLSYGNVLTVARLPSGDKVHQTEKPVDVIEPLVKVLTPAGGVVLDPFMGSGTTLIACTRQGRRGIGIEIDPHNFDVACRRVDDAMRQGDMFVAPPLAPIQEALI